MSIVHATADTVYSRKNNSILSVSNLSPSLVTEDIEIDEILYTLETIFAPDVHLIADEATTALVQWVVDVLQTSHAATATSLLQAILIAPLLYFQPSFVYSHFPSFANNPLPSYLTVKVEYGEFVRRMLLDDWTVILFLVFSFLIYVTFARGSFGQ